MTLDRKTDGYFVGSNFPINPKLAAEETDFPVDDPGVSGNARGFYERHGWTLDPSGAPDPGNCCPST